MERHIRLYGNTIVELTNRRYNVMFDDGIIKGVMSNTFHVEKGSALLPPDKRLPHQQTSAAVSAIVLATVAESNNDDSDHQDQEDKCGDPQNERHHND